MDLLIAGLQEDMDLFLLRCLFLVIVLVTWLIFLSTISDDCLMNPFISECHLKGRHNTKSNYGLSHRQLREE
jgi:hypothetical protein